MTWQILMAVLGVAVLAWTGVRRGRANPGLVLNRARAHPPVQPRGNPALVGAGVFLAVFGFSSMQGTIGSWAYGGMVVMAAAVLLPIVVHNRAVRRTATWPQPT